MQVIVSTFEHMIAYLRPLLEKRKQINKRFRARISVIKIFNLTHNFPRKKHIINLFSEIFLFSSGLQCVTSSNSNKRILILILAKNHLTIISNLACVHCVVIPNAQKIFYNPNQYVVSFLIHPTNGNEHKCMTL